MSYVSDIFSRRSTMFRVTVLLLVLLSVVYLYMFSRFIRGDSVKLAS